MLLRTVGSCEGKDKDMRRGSSAAAARGEAGKEGGGGRGKGGGTSELRASAY